MDVLNRRRGGVKTSVVAGSVWETRMKLDQVKGGIKVFNGETNSGSNDEESSSSSSSSKRLVKKTTIAKRKTWKAGSSDDQFRELSASVDGGMKKNLFKKQGRSDNNNNNNRDIMSLSVDGLDKKKARSEIGKVRSDQIKRVVDSVSDTQLGKVKLESVNEKNSVDELKKLLKSDDLVIKDDNDGDLIEKNPIEIEQNGSEECCREFVVCQETDNDGNGSPENQEHSNASPGNQEHSNASPGNQEHGGDNGELDEEEEEEMCEEMEIEKKSIDDKMEIVNLQEEQTKTTPEAKEPAPAPPQVNDIKKVEISEKEEKISKKIGLNEESKKKVDCFKNRGTPPPTSSITHKQSPPVIKRASIYQNSPKPTSIPVVNEYQSSHSKLQNIVELVMWRDISRSAFVFGIGTFIIISSSYTKDLNVSFISVMSYAGLAYLALIFLYRTLICRGSIEIDDDDKSYVVGEAEAVWLLKLVLPYLNECLLKIKALFSGDPATTMKMAVLLFVFARCGSSFTIWKLAKLGFFGVFTVPKVFTSYSAQITAYGKFWIRRFRDAWDSCSHKKAVALAIFTLVWNLSSMVARVWAVFMMFVAVRYYQQSMEVDGEDDWMEDAAPDDDEPPTAQKQGIGKGTTLASAQVNKIKKWS